MPAPACGIAASSTCVAAFAFSSPCSITPVASITSTNARSCCSSRSAAFSSGSTTSARAATAVIIAASVPDRRFTAVATSNLSSASSACSNASSNVTRPDVSCKPATSSTTAARRLLWHRHRRQRLPQTRGLGLHRLRAVPHRGNGGLNLRLRLTGRHRAFPATSSRTPTHPASAPRVPS